MSDFAQALIFYILLIIVLIVILYQFDHTHWNGLDKKNDNTFGKRLINRLYFSTTTLSTAGYGDITPKTISAKIIVMIMQLVILIGIIEFMVKWI